LGQLTELRTLEFTNNAIIGAPPEFLRGAYQHVPGRTVGITGNPYYCPLPAWAVPVAVTNAAGEYTGQYTGGYTGIRCEHCPGDEQDPKYLLPDGRPDFTYTCSGHGQCRDGTTCICEAEWSLDPDRCSLLSCPKEEVTLVDGSTDVAHCSGVGACINIKDVALNATTVACDSAGNPLVLPEQLTPPPIVPAFDYIHYAIDCQARLMTIAQCDCPLPTQSAPKCEKINVAAAKLEVVGSAGRRGGVRSGAAAMFLGAVIAMVLSVR
jgi:hypothetical protein